MPSRINPYTGEVVLTELPSGLAFAGRTNSDMTPSKTAVVCAQLAGYGDDYFNNHFFMQVIKGANELLTIDDAPAPADFAAGAILTGGASEETCVVVAKLTSTTYIVKSRSGAFTDGEIISDGTNSVNCGAGYPTFAAAAAPEHEVRKITDYVSLTGTFTVDAFTQVVDVLDEILVVHESLVSLGRDDADNVFDSSAVTKNRDGSVLERTEFIIDALMGTQTPFRTEQSNSGTVEEDAFEMFNISLFDLDSGAIASASIDIAAITATMEKSTGGADFSNAGITQPTFVKADGRVYCSYRFLAAQWAVGDLYWLTVSGITATVDDETVYCPTMVWSNAVLEAKTIDANVEAIQTDIGDPSARTNLQSLMAMLGNPDAAGKTLYANLGDFFGQTNLQSLLAAMGIPDVAGKSLYVCLVTDRLDSAVYGLGALHTHLADIETVVDDLHDTDLPAVKTVIDNIRTTALPAVQTVVDNLHGDLLTVAGYIDTEVADLDADLVAAKAVIDDIHTADLPAVKTVIDDIHTTDLPVVKTVIDDIHTTDLPAVKTEIETTSLGVAGGSGAANQRAGKLLRYIADNLSAGSPTEIETTSLNAGGGSIDNAARAGLLLRYIIDNAAKTGVDGDTLETLSDQIDLAQTGFQGGTDAVNRVAGKMQVKATTIDLAQIVGAYDLFTGTTQDVVVEKLSFRMPNVNVADDATITSISIQSNDATPQVLVSATLGVKANLTAEAQISWTGAVLLKAGKKIQLTIAGGAADAATVCDVVAEGRAVTGGGYLA